MTFRPSVAVGHARAHTHTKRKPREGGRENDTHSHTRENKSPIHANLRENDLLISETLKTSGQAFETRPCQGRRVVPGNAGADTHSRRARVGLITSGDALRTVKESRKERNTSLKSEGAAAPERPRSPCRRRSPERERTNDLKSAVPSQRCILLTFAPVSGWELRLRRETRSHAPTAREERGVINLLPLHPQQEKKEETSRLPA